jgi:hypothetical protein
MIDEMLKDRARIGSLCMIRDGVIEIQTHVPGAEYQIEIRRCQTPRDVIAWLYQLLPKTWFTMDHVQSFLDCTTEIVGITDISTPF